MIKWDISIARRIVGKRKIKSDFYGMSPAEGQKSKEAEIWSERSNTCDVVFKVHSTNIFDTILRDSTARILCHTMIGQLVETFQASSTAFL